MESSSQSSITNPVWDIFAPDHSDMSTVEREWIEYREMNVSNTETQTRLEIETRDKDAFLLPHEGYLEVRYKITDSANPPVVVPATDVIALQNNILSLFSNIEYNIEDQRIEYIDNPGLAWTIKNLNDFSRQYGDSVSSNEHFYLDTQDSAKLQLQPVKFFNNVAGAAGGSELTLAYTATPAVGLVGTVANTNPVIALIGNFGITGAAYAGVTSNQVLFRNDANGAPVTFTSNATPELVGSVNAVTKLDAFLSKTGERVYFYCQGVLCHLSTGAGGLLTIVRSDSTPVAANDVITAQVHFMRDTYYNKRFDSRYKRVQKAITTGDGTVAVMIPFKNMFSFCRAYDRVSRGLCHRIVLNKQTSYPQVLHRFGGIDRTVTITYVSAWIPRLKPNLETLKSVEAKLMSNESYTLNFTDLTLSKTNLVNGVNGSQNSYLSAMTSKKPIRVWVAFQTATRFDGDQSSNRRVFDTLKMTAIHVRLNGALYPMYEYKFSNHANGEWQNYNRAYKAFLDADYKNNDSSDGSLVTYEMFGQLYPIFYFDLTNQPEDLYKAHKQAELEVRYTVGQTVTHYMYMLVESERQIILQGISGSLAVSL